MGKSIEKCKSKFQTRWEDPLEESLGYGEGLLVTFSHLKDIFPEGAESLNFSGAGRG